MYLKEQCKFVLCDLLIFLLWNYKYVYNQNAWNTYSGLQLQQNIVWIKFQGGANGKQLDQSIIQFEGSVDIPKNSYPWKYVTLQYFYCS